MCNPGVALWRLLALVCFAAASAAAWAAAPVGELDAQRQPIPLVGIAEAWIEPGDKALAADVARDPQIPWAPLRSGAIHHLTTGHVLWVRFTVRQPGENAGWNLRIQYPSVNRATLFALDDSHARVPPSAGDTIAVADWPLPHRQPLLPLGPVGDSPSRYLLRVENPHAFSAPLTLVSRSYLGSEEQRASFLLGMYFGLAGLATAVALLSAAVLRDGTYARYALAIVAMALAQAAATGIGGVFLWPRNAWWNDVAPLALPVLAASAFLWFFSSAVSLAERYRRLHRGLIVLAVLGVVVAVTIALVQPSLRYRLQVPFVIGACVAGASVLFWAGRRGDRHAIWMLWALLPVALTALLPVAAVTGLVPLSGWTLHAMPVAISLELPVLLVILMLRSQERREFGRRLHGTDRLDADTGLANVDLFAARVDRSITRAQRMKYQSLLLLVEITNVDQIRRNFDRRWADRLALHVAGRLLSVAREVDTVGRLGQHRFAMLVEGPLTPEEAGAMAQRVVARCLMPAEGKPAEWVAQVRVAQAMLPIDGASGAELVERLQGLLERAPPDSRRAVYTLEAEPQPA